MPFGQLAQSNELDPTLYPDVVQAGGFPALIQDTLASIGSKLTVETMELPYSHDCPIVVAAGDDRFYVHARKENQSLIDSLDPVPAVDVNEAVRLAVLALPAGVGPARPGTADDPK
jgi:Family of unknown function (DUF6193)